MYNNIMLNNNTQSLLNDDQTVIIDLYHLRNCTVEEFQVFCNNFFKEWNNASNEADFTQQLHICLERLDAPSFSPEKQRALFDVLEKKQCLNFLSKKNLYTTTYLEKILRHLEEHQIAKLSPQQIYSLCWYLASEKVPFIPITSFDTWSLMERVHFWDNYKNNLTLLQKQSLSVPFKKLRYALSVIMLVNTLCIATLAICACMGLLNRATIFTLCVMSAVIATALCILFLLLRALPYDNDNILLPSILNSLINFIVCLPTFTLGLYYLTFSRHVMALSIVVLAIAMLSMIFLCIMVFLPVVQANPLPVVQANPLPVVQANPLPVVQANPLPVVQANLNVFPQQNHVVSPGIILDKDSNANQIPYTANNIHLFITLAANPPHHEHVLQPLEWAYAISQKTSKQVTLHILPDADIYVAIKINKHGAQRIGITAKKRATILQHYYNKIITQRPDLNVITTKIDTFIDDQARIRNDNIWHDHDRVHTAYAQYLGMNAQDLWYIRGNDCKCCIRGHAGMTILLMPREQSSMSSSAIMDGTLTPEQVREAKQYGVFEALQTVKQEDCFDNTKHLDAFHQCIAQHAHDDLHTIQLN
jgi:hypothetical protein